MSIWILYLWILLPYTHHAWENAIYWEEIKCRRLFGFPEMCLVPSTSSASNQAARYAWATGCWCLLAVPRAAYLCCVSQPVTDWDAHGYALNSPPIALRHNDAHRIANIALQAIYINIWKFFSLPFHGTAHFCCTFCGWNSLSNCCCGVLGLQPKFHWVLLSYIYGAFMAFVLKVITRLFFPHINVVTAVRHLQFILPVSVLRDY